MPGRIVGRTTDLDGNLGFTLTLQAREQHIRRSKATSNICTNQGLMVTAATIYMSLLGAEGIAQVGRKSHENTTRLVDGLCAIDGIERLYEGPYFHEVALRFDRPVAPVLDTLAAKNILGGFDLSDSAGTDALLVCATETKTDADIDACIAAFAEAMG
jgi:glycine dehydrogenase subunit 1